MTRVVPCSYLVGYTLVDCTDAEPRIPYFKGHQWAEPSVRVTHFCSLLRGAHVPCRISSIDCVCARLACALRVLDTPICVWLGVVSRVRMLHVASCMLHRACCMLHRAWQLVGSRSVGCTCAGLGSASEDEARRGRAWRGKSQGAARPVGCAGEVSAHEGRPTEHAHASSPAHRHPARIGHRPRALYSARRKRPIRTELP